MKYVIKSSGQCGCVRYRCKCSQRAHASDVRLAERELTSITWPLQSVYSRVSGIWVLAFQSRRGRGRGCGGFGCFGGGDEDLFTCLPDIALWQWICRKTLLGRCFVAISPNGRRVSPSFLLSSLDYSDNSFMRFSCQISTAALRKQCLCSCSVHPCARWKPPTHSHLFPPSCPQVRRRRPGHQRQAPHRHRGARQAPLLRLRQRVRGAHPLRDERALLRARAAGPRAHPHNAPAARVRGRGGVRAPFRDDGGADGPDWDGLDKGAVRARPLTRGRRPRRLPVRTYTGADTRADSLRIGGHGDALCYSPHLPTLIAQLRLLSIPSPSPLHLLSIPALPRYSAKVASSKKPIGALLMDQAVIAGVGNIFRAEARAATRVQLWPCAPRVCHARHALCALCFARDWESELPSTHLSSPAGALQGCRAPGATREHPFGRCGGAPLAPLGGPAAAGVPPGAQLRRKGGRSEER